MPEGVSYSSILGETGLTTSKLNYHLIELEGFIEKDEDNRLYRLTNFGHKAISLLKHIDENLDEEDIKLSQATENQRRKYIEKQLNGLFSVLMAIFSVGPLLLTYFYLTDSGAGITSPMLALTIIVCGSFIIGFNQARKNSPKYLLSFVDWLDWKFFNGNNVRSFRGRKMFVLTILGFVVGAFFNKAGLGLIIGLFLGAAMETKIGV